MKPLGVAEVRDHLAAVDVGLEEAELHAVERTDTIGVRTVVHQLRGRRAQDPPAVVLAVLQVRDHEVRHVLAGRGGRARRRRTDVLERLRLAGSDAVAGRHERREVLRQRLPEARVLHVERLEDVVLDVGVERLAVRRAATM